MCHSTVTCPSLTHDLHIQYTFLHLCFITINLKNTIYCTMADFDPYSIIKHVMNNSFVDLPRPTPLCELQLRLVNFVLVVAYGSSRYQVIPKDQFCVLQRHDVFLCYNQSIPIPPVVDWLCCKLQAPFGDYADIVALGIAYFSLLDNNWS
jgi:hypothetical protein